MPSNQITSDLPPATAGLHSMPGDLNTRHREADTFWSTSITPEELFRVYARDLGTEYTLDELHILDTGGELDPAPTSPADQLALAAACCATLAPEATDALDLAVWAFQARADEWAGGWHVQPDELWPLAVAAFNAREVA